MARKKLYLVKYEVIAGSVREAIRVSKKRGEIYEVVVTDEKNWPEENKPMLKQKK